ncbi:Chitinase [hydrothermal vent metagenome]|uniref:Chitinase n=1 Tax=hydrothermal vent metagenome TaxID=652676 RepID=A0A3B1ALE6_9ZZZZ
MSPKYLTALALLLLTHHVSLSAETITSHRNGLLSVEKGHAQNKIRMLRGSKGSIPLRDTSQRPLHEKVANQFAPEFGLRNPANQLIMKHSTSHNGKTSIRYQQMHLGLPVIAGELVANLNARNEVNSMSGEISTVLINDITPTISAYAASNMAIAAVSKWYQIENSQLTASSPVLSLYDTSLLQNSTSSSYLVWKIDVRPSFLSAINEYILVDALHGGIILHFNQVHTVLNRLTYTAGNTQTIPGTLVCDESAPTCVGGDQDAIDAHTNAANVYDFYLLNHGRDSIDGNGMAIVSTTHFGGAAGSANPYQNAGWVGAPFNQMIYGDNFSSADDVVGHEITHGVTDFTSDLFYYSESGAINESLSDVWGEFIDQTNNIGNDLPGVAWLMGEDLPIGAIRDMSNPPAFSDPDRMTSNLFVIGYTNNGGVHSNSGVNNKAAFLMVEGGTFNGRTITPLGIPKVADIYYEAQTNLLTSGSDFLDLYNALNQACTNLIGVGSVNVINANDCSQVQLALEAVEMNQTPNASYAPTAEICPVGINVYDLFFDDFEANNTSNWNTLNASGSSNVWQTSTTNISGSTTGNYTVQANGYTSSGTNRINDSSLAYRDAIRVPISTSTYIHFDHAFYFETGFDSSLVLRNFDGSLIEYTINNGTTWLDANSLIETGRSYTGPLYSSNTALNNRNAYTRFSNGYNQTRLNLSSLAGNNVRFRFRSIADEIVTSPPWSIDNFRVYMCTNNAPPVPNAGADQDFRINKVVQLAGSATDADGDTLSYSWAQTAGPTVTLSDTTILNPSFTTPRNTTSLQFILSVTDTAGQTESDSINITTNGNIGSGSGCSVGKNGRFDPIWILLLSFLTLIHLRRRKKIKI